MIGVAGDSERIFLCSPQLVLRVKVIEGYRGRPKE